MLDSPVPTKTRDPAAHRGLEGALLHRLAAPAGRRQVRRRSGVRRRSRQIKSTLDYGLQQAAEQAVSDNVGGLGPTSAVVAIDNGSGEVLAMVGGQDFAPGSLQPRDERTAAARLVVQAFHARDRVEGGSLARRDVRVRTAGAAVHGDDQDEERQEEGGHRQVPRRTTTTTTTSAPPRSPRQPPIRTTPSTPSSVSRSGSTTSSRPRTRWGSPRRSTTTRRSSSAASRRASPRSRWPTPSTRWPTAAQGSAAPRRARATARARLRSTRSSTRTTSPCPTTSAAAARTRRSPTR